MYEYIDFSFNGKFLRDFGFMTCYFDGTGESESSVGTALSNKSARPANSYLWHDLGDVYDEPEPISVDICKKCHSLRTEDSFVTVEEERELIKWLKQARPFKEFYFVPLSDVHEPIYFDVKVTEMTAKKFGQSVIGYNIKFLPSTPFGLSKKRVIEIDGSQEEAVQSIIVNNDSTDYIYPKITIVNHTGNALIKNETNRYFSNVYNLNEETVVIDKNNFGIHTDVESHDIIEDFSKTWFRLQDGENVVRTNCNLILEYREPIKVSM